MNSPGNFLSLPRKYELQDYTGNAAKAPHGTLELSFQELMTHKHVHSEFHHLILY